MRCCECDYRYECSEAEPDIVGFGYCRTRDELKNLDRCATPEQSGSAQNVGLTINKDKTIAQHLQEMLRRPGCRNAMKDDERKALISLQQALDGVSTDRLRELVQSDSEGRVVVLPERLPLHARQTSIDKDCLTDLRKPGGDFAVLPCPFCGSENIFYWQYLHGQGLRWRICCIGCMAMIDPGWVQQYGYLAEMWNRRAEAALAGKEEEQDA